VLSELGHSRELEEIRGLVRKLSEKLNVSDGGPPDAVSVSALEERLEQLAEFATMVGASQEFDRVVEDILHGVLRITGSAHVYMSAKESDKTYTDRCRSADRNDPTMWGTEKIARAVVDQVIDTRDALVIYNVAKAPAVAEDADAYGVDLGCLACAPLVDNSGVHGAIYIDRTTKVGTFHPRDIKVLGALASIACRALTNARNSREQVARRQHLEMLNRLYEAISRTLELEQLLDQVCTITLDVTQAERAFILLLNNGQLRFGAGRDAGGPLAASAAREMSKSVCQKVLQTQQGVYVFDTASDEEFSKKLSIVNLKLNAIVAVPLKGQEGLSGLLYIDSRNQSLTQLEKEMMVLTNIANVAALAVDNARLYRQATVDGLTGLFVRSFFMLRMEEEIQRSGRYGRQFSLLVMDIDHFKKFNDNYGHQTGDEVIKLVSQVIKRAIRTGVDVPGRYGGEELVLLLPETNLEGGLVVAERIRKNVENMPLPGPKGETLKVTISIGLAEFPSAGDSAVVLFEHADQALYVSKQQGRNRTTIYNKANIPPGSVDH